MNAFQGQEVAVVKRLSNGESTIYEDKNGRRHSGVWMGLKEGGAPDRARSGSCRSVRSSSDMVQHRALSATRR